MQNNTYAVIPEIASTSVQKFGEIAIDKRYPSRRAMRDSRSPVSSSGYGSCSQSNSSIDTVINAAKPYTVTRPVNIDLPPTTSASAPKTSMTKNNIKRPCCVQCRETEIRQTEGQEYENLEKLAPNPEVHPYVLLMVSIFRNQRHGENPAKLAKIQRNVEKVLHFEQQASFSLENESTFESQLKNFSRDVEIRLRAINDVSSDTFRDVSKRFCDALHANSSGLKAIYKSFKAIFKS